jgi:hypothetical protein
MIRDRPVISRNGLEVREKWKIRRFLLLNGAMTGLPDFMIGWISHGKDGHAAVENEAVLPLGRPEHTRGKFEGRFW